ncbi:MAG: type IV toxin-antitoxin system AbiEi family antitoxin [Phycisphaerae bacterium]
MQNRGFLPSDRRKLMIPVLALPWVSPRMAELCKENSWCWFDLAGNYWIDVPGSLHLEHTGNAPVYKRQTPMANLSTREASRVMRVFLQPQYAQTRWTQRELQKDCRPEVSLGLINRVVRRLRDEAYIEAHSRGGFRLRDPLKLLFAWRDVYRFDRHERRGYFTLLQGKRQRDALAELGLRTDVSVLYAAFSAAELQAPHVRQPKTWLYVRDRDIPAFEKLIEAKPVDSGENLTVLIPDDEGVRYMCEDGTVGDNHLGCTNIVQTYVDLWHCGGRGKEAADALLEQRLKPAWKAQGVL